MGDEQLTIKYGGSFLVDTFWFVGRMYMYSKYTLTHRHNYTHAYAYTRTYAHCIHQQTHTHTYSYTYTHIYTPTHTPFHTHLHPHTYTHTFAHTLTQFFITQTHLKIILNHHGKYLGLSRFYLSISFLIFSVYDYYLCWLLLLLYYYYRINIHRIFIHIYVYN